MNQKTYLKIMETDKLTIKNSQAAVKKITQNLEIRQKWWVETLSVSYGGKTCPRIVQAKG